MGRARGRNRGRRIDKAVHAGLARGLAQQGSQPVVHGLASAINSAVARVANEQGGFGMAPFPRDPRDDVAFGPSNPARPDPFDPARRDTGRPEPRVFEYPVAFNLPGSGNKLIPWNVLYAAADNVDILRRCIEIRKKELRGLEWAFTLRKDVIDAAYQADGKRGRDAIEAELREKFMPEIVRATEFWKAPWRANGLKFGQWVNGFVDQHYTLDAVAVYPSVSYGGELLGLELIDAATIKPLLNYRGVRPGPEEDFPAFQQSIYGYPRGEWTATEVIDPVTGQKTIPGAYMADQLWYYRENFRPNTPYGLSAVEQALISARLYLKRQGWMLAEYDDGSTPLMWLAPDGTPQMMAGANAMTADQRRAWEQGLNSELTGQTAARHRIKVTPPGFKPIPMPSVDERYKPDYDLFLIKMLASHFGVFSTQLGFNESEGLGNSGLHDGQSAAADKVAGNPDVKIVAEAIDDLSRQFLRIPKEIVFGFVSVEGEDSVAEDATAAAQRGRGTITLNDDRRRLGLGALAFPEADMPLVGTGSTWVPLEGLAERLEQQDAQAQQLADAKANGDVAVVADKGAIDKAVEGEGLHEAKADELAAFTRWHRKNPEPRRPFLFKFCAPDDVNDPDPDIMAFEGWVFEDHEDLTKGYDPNQKRARDGKWTRMGLGGILGSIAPEDSKRGASVLRGLKQRAKARETSSSSNSPINDSSSTISGMDTPETLAPEVNPLKPSAEVMANLRAQAEKLFPRGTRVGGSGSGLTSTSGRMVSPKTTAREWLDGVEAGDFRAAQNAAYRLYADLDAVDPHRTSTREARAMVVDVQEQISARNTARFMDKYGVKSEGSDGTHAPAVDTPEETFDARFARVKAEIAQRDRERNAAVLARHDAFRAKVGDLHPESLDEARALAARAGLHVFNDFHGPDGGFSVAFAERKDTNGSRIANFDSRRGWTKGDGSRMEGDDRIAATLDEGKLKTDFHGREYAVSERLKAVENARAAADKPTADGGLRGAELDAATLSAYEERRAAKAKEMAAALPSAKAKRTAKAEPKSATESAAALRSAESTTAVDALLDPMGGAELRALAEEMGLDPKARSLTILRQRIAADRKLRLNTDAFLGSRDADAPRHQASAAEIAAVRAAYTPPGRRERKPMPQTEASPETGMATFDVAEVRGAQSQASRIEATRPQSAAAAALGSAVTMDEVGAVLRPLTKPKLLALAAEVGMAHNRSERVDELKRQLARHALGGRLTANAVLGSRDDVARPTVTATLESRIVDKVKELRSRPGALLSLVHMRDAFPDVPRAEMDRELKRLDRARIIQLDPDPNRKAIPPEAHEAAIELGGEAKHMITVVPTDEERDAGPWTGERLSATEVQAGIEARLLAALPDWSKMRSRAEAEEALGQLSASELRIVARSFDTSERGNHREVLDRVVDRAVGRRLDSEAVRGTVEELGPVESPVRAALRAATSEEEGHALLAKMSRDELHALSTELGLNLAKSTPPKKLREWIVKVTVGGRLVTVAMDDWGKSTPTGINTPAPAPVRISPVIDTPAPTTTAEQRRAAARPLDQSGGFRLPARPAAAEPVRSPAWTALRAAATEEEGDALVAKMGKDELHRLAVEIGLNPAKSETAKNLRAYIVKVTVGGRVVTAAMDDRGKTGPSSPNDAAVAVLRERLANGDIMLGSDRSQWTPRQRADAAKIEAELAALTGAPAPSKSKAAPKMPKPREAGVSEVQVGDWIYDRATGWQRIHHIEESQRGRRQVFAEGGRSITTLTPGDAPTIQRGGNRPAGARSSSRRQSESAAMRAYTNEVLRLNALFPGGHSNRKRTHAEYSDMTKTELQDHARELRKQLTMLHVDHRSDAQKRRDAAKKAQ